MKVFVILVAFIGLAAAQQARPDPRCPTHPADQRPTIFGDPFNCENYFRCNNGMSIQFQCPRGRHFSPRSHTCEPIHVAQCTQSIAPPVLPPANNNNNFLDCPAFDTPGEFIYHAHPQDCQQFFQCSGGRAVLLKCPSGHSWNMQRTFCDQERNVHCTLPRF